MNFTGMFLDANTNTGGWLGNLVPWLIALIVYANLSIFGFSKAISGAMFIAFISSLPLYALDIIGGEVMVLLTVATLVAVVLELKS